MNDSPEEMQERTLYGEVAKQVGDTNSGIIGDVFQAARKGNWKAVRYTVEGETELYDIIKDPGESNNLATKHPELAKEFYQLFEKYKD